MKDKIHPTYHQATVTCACGNTFTTGSTQDSIQTELCSNCHPFYTGKQNLVDTAGRVERFQAMLKRTQSVKKDKEEKAEKQEAEAPEQSDEESTQAKLQELKKTLENK